MRARPPALSRLWLELRRRKVWRLAAAYLAGAAGIIALASDVVPALHLPDSAVTLVVVLAVLGFPVALVLAWRYDLTWGGVERTGRAPTEVVPPAAARPGRLREAASAEVPASPGPTAGAHPEAPRPESRQGAPPHLSVPVLPFVNMSADAENEYFSDGITEELLNTLVKVPGLRVPARTSSFYFKGRATPVPEIGAALRVAHVVEGSVRKAGERVRITAQLISAADSYHLWSESYDRDLSDILALQQEIACSITRALATGLSRGWEATVCARTVHAAAYDYYLRGRRCLYHFTEEGLLEAIAHFEHAVQIDPRFAAPFAESAVAYAALGMGHGAGRMRPRDAYSRGQAAALQALELDDGLGQAHTGLGFLSFLSDFDWATGERECRRGIELSPSDAIAHDVLALLLSARSRFDEAVYEQRLAQALDPLNPLVHSDLASTLLRAGRLDEALREAEGLLACEPAFPLAHSTRGWALLLKGRQEEGVAELERAAALSPENTILTAQLGQAYGMAGRGPEAYEVLDRLQALAQRRFVTPYHMAYIYTGLGLHDRAVDCLETALEERSGGIYAVGGSFLFAPLRGHARFRALLARMKLTDASASAG